jgi:hypothetical protein
MRKRARRSEIFISPSLPPPTRIPPHLSIDLLSVTAPLGESRPSPRGLAEHDVAATAKHDALRVTEDGRDLEASGALDVHEEAIRALHEALELVSASLEFGRRVEEVDGHLFFPFLRVCYSAVG